MAITPNTPALDREVLAKIVVDAFEERGQVVDTGLLENVTSALERSLAGSGVTVTSPKSFAQQIVDNLDIGAKADAAKQQQR